MPDAPASVLPEPSAGSPPSAPPAVLAEPSSGSPPTSPASILAQSGADVAPYKIRITGISDPSGSDPLILTKAPGLLGGMSHYAFDAFLVYYEEGKWTIDSGAAFFAEKASDAISPVGLTGWTVTIGVASPVLTVEEQVVPPASVLPEPS